MSPFTIKIHSAEFFGDVKHMLRGLIEGIKLSHLDECVVRGFGYKNRAAALAAVKSGPVTVSVDDDAFRSRLSEFGVTVASGMFVWNVREAVTDSAGKNSVFAILDGETVTLTREEELRILRDADGNPIVSFDDPDNDDPDNDDLDDDDPDDDPDDDSPLKMGWEHMQNSRGWR